MLINLKTPAKFRESTPGGETEEGISPHLLRAIRYSIIGLLALGAGYIIVLQTLNWMGNSEWFQLSKIIVEGNYVVGQREIASLIVLSKNPHLINLPLEVIRNQIEAHPWIAHARIHRVFPSTLKVEIEERKPAALVLSKNTFLVDEEGVVLPHQKNVRVHDVPCITGIADLAVDPGKKCDNANLKESLEILQALRSINPGVWFKISELSWQEGPSCLIYLYDYAIPIRIPKEGRLKERLFILSQFLHYAESENKLQDIAFIDVMYEGQLITKNHR